jgi:hypothetical protein
MACTGTRCAFAPRHAITGIGVHALQARTLLTLATIGLALARCAPPPAPPAQPAPPPLPPHFGPPAASSCTVAPFHAAEGHETEVLMTVGNDGGYCAATLTAASGKPFDAPLIPSVAEPQHGTARVVPYNGKTSVEYTPDAGYTGHDHFAVRLIVRGVPGYTTLNMSITVAAK